MQTDPLAKNNGFWLRTLALMAGLALLFGACQKDKEILSSGCPTNCKIVQVEGTLYDPSGNLPLAGQPITVTLNQNPFCLPCSSFRLASGVSDNNGHFQLSYNLDTNLLRQFYVLVSVPIPSNYILFPILRDSISNRYALTTDTRHFGYGTLDSMQGLKFEFYSVTPLQVRLHRSSAIVPQNPYLFLYVNIDGSDALSSLSITQTEANKDTSFVLSTSPNLYTKINWNKYTNLETVRSATDSIRCKPAGDNTIDIYY